MAKTHPSLWPGLLSPKPIELRESFERVQEVAPRNLNTLNSRRPSLGRYPTLPRSQAWLSNGTPQGANGNVAALPVDYLDGGTGALSLLGSRELSGEAFDIVVDLLNVVPSLCVMLAERGNLALVRRCDDILQDSEAGSVVRPPDDLSLGHAYLGGVCRTLTESLRCRQVTIYLREPGSSDEAFAPVASSADEDPPGPAVQSGIGLVGRAIKHAEPMVASGEDLDADPCGMMVTPVIVGDQVLGAVACRGSTFTRADVAASGLVASRVAQYWRNRLHQYTDSADGRSWLLLAAGITAFNKLASEELARDEPDDQQIYQAATEIVQDVVPDSAGCEVHRTAVARSGAPRLYRIRSSKAAGDNESRRRPGTGSFALSALRSGRQQATTDPHEISRQGLDVGWLMCTPIHIGGEPYGVLEVFGRGTSVPANARQASEIIGDQLGLYLHLRRALSGLQEIRGELQATTRSQADALEDLEHQLGGPLRIATERVDQVLHSGRLDSRADSHLRAARGLCRKATRVALSAGVFAALSKGLAPRPKLELLSADDVLRLLIAGADDAQLLSNPKRRIHFEVDRDRIRELGRRLLQVDRSFLEQCVGNVLDNAAKYSYEDTAVEIAAETTDDKFAVTVTSTGLPLNPVDAKYTLQRNWRGPSARAATGEGSGLGLWIADHLMRSMTGSVRVHPVQDSTTVLLTFPLMRPTPGRPQ